MANQTIKPRYLPNSTTCVSDASAISGSLSFHNSDWRTKGGEVIRLSTCPYMPLFNTVAWIQKNSQSNYTTASFPYYSYHAWNYVCESRQKNDPPMFIQSFPIKEDKLSPLSCNKEYESRHAPTSTPFPFTWTTLSSSTSPLKNLTSLEPHRCVNTGEEYVLKRDLGLFSVLVCLAPVGCSE